MLSSITCLVVWLTKCQCFSLYLLLLVCICKEMFAYYNKSCALCMNTGGHDKLFYLSHILKKMMRW
jgi:hypothetical protein